MRYVKPQERELIHVYTLEGKGHISMTIITDLQSTPTLLSYATTLAKDQDIRNYKQIKDKTRDGICPPPCKTNASQDANFIIQG